MKKDDWVNVAYLAALTFMILELRKARRNGAPSLTAASHLGKWKFYANLARFSGERALQAESAYWKLVRHGIE